jgi:hypothetical protein
MVAAEAAAHGSATTVKTTTAPSVGASASTAAVAAPAAVLSKGDIRSTHD